MFDDVQQWFRAFAQPTVLVELGTLAVCVALAWLMVSAVRRAVHRNEPRSILFGRKVVDGVLFPLTLLGLVYVARAVVVQWVPLAAFKLVIPVLISLVVIRVGVKVLQAAFPQAAWVRPIERSISWLAWLAMVLWVTGLLPLVLQQLDEITWKVGASTLSVRTMIEGVVTACAVLIVTLWISSAIETRLLRSVTGSELSVRKAFSNAARALLMFLGLILALSAVGIDLTALSVLGAHWRQRPGGRFRGPDHRHHRALHVDPVGGWARIHRAQRDADHAAGRKPLTGRPACVDVHRGQCGL